MDTKQYNKTELETIFSHKLTENGDNAFSSTGNTLVDILFMAEYYTKHPKEVIIDNSPIAKLFSMFMRDPRFGMGYRDLGRNLMYLADLTAEEVVKCGRYDDLFLATSDTGKYNPYWINHLLTEVFKGNELAKKWMPRYSSKHLMIAREFAQSLGFNKQQYGKLIKANTVENTMSRNDWESINFEHVPSLAAIKYVKAFQRHQPERYQQYLDDVKSGKKQLHIATTNVYDIYRNRYSIDADLFFSKIEKISGSWIPIVDSSGSMQDVNDSYGKAMAIGHYLAKCSTYCPNQVISFSSRPQLITLGKMPEVENGWYNPPRFNSDSNYQKEISSMHTGDCSNTDFGAVMNMLSNLKTEMPEYLVVLSDMEFDRGSSMSKDTTMQLFKSNNWSTKIIWWNLNSRNKTAPETDNYGNIFISGYTPMLLKYLETGFDAQQFLQKLLEEYAKNIGYTLP